MEKIIVEQNTLRDGSNRYIPYLYNKLKKTLAGTSSELQRFTRLDVSCLTLESEKNEIARTRRLANEHISDVLVVGYKYEFFKSRLSLPLLSAEEKFLTYAALVSADYKEDKRYALRRLGSSKICSIDGTYVFRLSELRARWLEVVEYIPPDFGSYELESFLDYIVGENDEKAYVKEGKAYDENYRELQKSELLGRSCVIAELLLFGAGSVYCFGKVDEATATFLRKYYKEKALFC